VKRGDYEVSSDPARLDVDAIHAFLTTSYWCPGIPKELIERAIRGSLCFGLYFHLVTRDAHGLYTKLGFKSLEKPEGHMEIRRPDVYQEKAPRE